MRTKNVFISHSWGYGNPYERLCQMLDHAHGFAHRKYGISKSHPVYNGTSVEALHQSIRQQMAFCDVVLLMAGKYVMYTEWVDEEIRLARSGYTFRKPILAIRPSQEEQVSPVVLDAADRVVDWDANVVVSAIRNLAP